MQCDSGRVMSDTASDLSVFSINPQETAVHDQGVNA
jgi:hypothetical protein